MSRGKHLSSQELEFIKVHSLDMTIKEIAEKLGRNYWTVHRVMQGMNISKNHDFTADEDFLIRKLYRTHRAKYIATKLGIDEVSVFNRAKKLRLKKNMTK